MTPDESRQLPRAYWLRILIANATSAFACIGACDVSPTPDTTDCLESSAVYSEQDKRAGVWLHTREEGGNTKQLDSSVSTLTTISLIYTEMITPQYSYIIFSEVVWMTAHACQKQAGVLVCCPHKPPRFPPTQRPFFRASSINKHTSYTCSSVIHFARATPLILAQSDATYSMRPGC